jgi:RNA polymerase sigma-70 factor (family 1)
MKESLVTQQSIRFCELANHDLLSYIQSGSKLAFSELYERNWKNMYNGAYKRLQNEILAQDVVQNVFTDIWERRESLQIQDLTAYLHGAVRLQCLKQASKNTQHSPLFEQLEYTLTCSSRTDHSIMEKEFSDLLTLWIDALPPKRREIFILHFVEEMPTNEIAAHLNIAQKTVQNQISIASSILRNRFEQTLLISLLCLPNI